MKKRNILICLLSFFGLFSLTPLTGAQVSGTSRLFSRNADAIVLVAASQTGSETKLGSGFIISEDGLMVTNYHIIENAEKIAVKLKNSKAYADARVMAKDPQKDIAVLKIRGEDFKKVRLGDSNEVDIGQRVVTIGNPLGLESTIADGLVSSKRQAENGLRLLQISVPLSEGSSGGPLFDLGGKVIGITTASRREGQNLNFALPINYAKPLIRQAKADKRKGQRRDFKITKKQAALYPQSQKLNFKIYTVADRDTLYSLAQRFATSVEELKELNNLQGTQIDKGQALRVPFNP